MHAAILDIHKHILERKNVYCKLMFACVLYIQLVHTYSQTQTYPQLNGGKFIDFHHMYLNRHAEYGSAARTILLRKQAKRKYYDENI